ncbi:MAG TPA: antibiotic biosynthesis monooxygenase [Chitinolyticbacter sp.]|nr:antibiotic biosynthesis monooxygenase [Chitinolyticbacter sp.]
MFSTTFIFEKKQYDDEFDRLDVAIAELARSQPDFAGEEFWEDPRSGRISAVYYWHGRDGVDALMRDASHLEVKRRYREWYHGYHVVIAEVLSAYGDGGFDHPVPPMRPDRA